MISKNTFEGGLNSDIHIKKLPRNFYVEGENIEIMGDGEYGAIMRISGNTYRARLVPGCPDGFKVLNSIVVDSPCGQGIAFFVYDNENGGQIVFYNHDSLFQITTTDFIGSDFVDVGKYSNNDKHYLYYTDGRNPLKVVEMACGPSAARNLRREATTDCIKFNRVETGGALTSGSVIGLYRYFNSETCLYSQWSNHSMAVPVLNDDRGGFIGEPTDKKIIFSIEGDGEGYDSVQLLVIKNDQGSKNTVTIGYLSSPSKEFYNNKEIEYTGLENELQVDLAEYIIDDAAILSAATLAFGDNRLFLGDVTLRDFSGSPKISKAKTITRKIPNEYKTEEECIESRSEFRGETIAYGVYYYDKFGNGVVFPLDLSSYSELFIDSASEGMVDVIGVGSRDFDEIEYAIATISGSVAAGDYISLDGKVGQILFIDDSGQAYIENSNGDWNIGDSGEYDLLVGKGGNNSDNWAWTYPERKDTKFTIFDSDGDINALGIKIEGLTDHPSWAVGYEIVRGKRIKNILGQSPHIPLIGVQGSPTSYRLERIKNFNGDNVADLKKFSSDYDYTLDYVSPKSFKLGTARNLVSISSDKEIDGLTAKYEHISEWVTQLVSDKKTTFGGGDGSEEGPKALSVMPGEYIHNVDGESFDWSLCTKMKIVDAVALSYEKKLQSIIEEYPNRIYSDGPLAVSFLYPFSLENVGVHVFSSLNRGNFFYNREGAVSLNGIDVGVDLSVLIDDNYNVDYAFPLSQVGSVASMPKRPFGEPKLQDLIKFGGYEELSREQFSEDPIPPEMLQWFNKSVKTQRQLLLGVDIEMKDFAYLMNDVFAKFNLDMFPFLDWESSEDVYKDDKLKLLIPGYDGDLTIDYEGKNIFTTEVVPSGNILGGSWVVNMEKGIGPERYGTIEEPKVEWCRTGICGKITSVGQVIDAEVFAGDCFITKHVYKVNETIPQPLSFVPLHFKLGDLEDPEFNPDSNKFGYMLTKTGHAKRNIEILEVYLESEVNANFERKVDQFPKVSDNKLSSYDEDWQYYYNPALSDQSCVKTLVNKSSSKSNNRLETAVWYSDIRVRGGESNAFVDIDGFSRFRANNFYLLNEEYGRVRKIVILNDKGLHVFQDDKIGFIPIGVDELQTIDGSLIAAGTSKVFGNGGFYIQRDVGCTDPLTIQERDGVIYAVDRNRKVIYKLASRGNGFEVISDKGNNARTEEFITGELVGHIDTARERYAVSNGDTMMVYSIKRGLWELTMDQSYYGVGDGERMLWIKDTELFRAYDGNTVFGEEKIGYLKIILNPDVDLTKVFRVLRMNSNGILEGRLTVWSENGEKQQGERKKAILRNSDHFINELRDIRNKKSKLRGHVAELEIWIPEGVLLNSVITEYRKSY